MKLKQFIFALVAMLLSFVSPAFAQNVAKVGKVEAIDVEATAEATTKVTFNVEPKNASGQKVSNPSAEITFRLPVPAAWSGKANVYHGSELLGAYTIKEESGAKYVEVKSSSFSEFSVEAIVPTEVEVATLAELQAALADNSNELPIVITAQIEIPAGVTVELDLNGKTVNSVFNGNSTTNHIYALSNKGTLTIQDSKGNGSVNSRGIYNYGSLTLNAGAINAIDGNGGYAVNNQSGSTFVMNGGVVAATYEDDHQSSSGGYDATALKVPAGCTATLNGGTINNVCDFTYAIDAAGTLNIPATSTITVNGTHGAIAVSGGVTTIDAGTFQIPADNYSRTDNVLYVSGGSLVVNGGTFIGDSDTASGGSCLYDEAGKAVVNGGTFKGSSGGDVWGTTGTTIKGGTFENLTEKQHIAAGYELNADGTVAAKSVASINGTKYTSLSEAVAAAQEGETITLIDNVVLAERVTIPADKTLTIDLNGKSISMEESIIATAYAINNLGNLTITDGVGGGSINARGIYNGYGDGAANVATAKITVVNGTINAKGTNGGGAAIFNYGVADIQGGTFTSVASYAIALQTGSTMTIGENAIITGGINSWQSTLTITGGTISNDKSGKHVVYAGESAVTINGGTFHNNNSGNATIMASGSTAAVEITGGTFTLNIVDASSSYLIDATSSATYTISGGSFTGGIRAQGGTKYEIAGGTFTNEYGNYNVYEGGDINISGGTFTGSYAQTFAKNNIADDYKLGEDGKVVYAPVVAKIGETKYETLDAAFAAATDGQTITMLVDATPALTSQRAITKAAVIDLGGKTLTLKEDDLYFGTTTFKNGTIVVDPSVKPSTAVFWMFANQTLTFDNVKVVATGVTGTYLIGLEGENSDLNLLNGSEILVENTTALDLDIICVNGTNTCDIKVENSKVNVTNLDGRVFFRGNYTVKDSEVNLAGITKAGFRIEAGQTLSIEGTSKVNIEGEPRDGGIHMTDLSATYTKAETATVNATLNRPAVAKIGDTPYYSFAEAAAAANAGDEIVMLADATVEGTLALPAGIKLTSNGHTITGSIRMLGDLELNGPLTITGGLWVGKSGETLTATLSGDKLTASYFMFQRGTYTIDADIDAVYGYLSYEGTFEVNSTIHTTGTNGEVLYINGNVTLNDGAVLDSDNSVFVCNDNAVLTLKPGSKVDSNVNITASGAKLNIDATGMTAGASANITGTVTNSGNGTIAVVGNDKLEASIVNGKVVLAAKPAAKIGEQGYATIKDAVAAVKESETITILAGTHSEGTIKLPATLKNVTIKGAEGAELKDMTISAADGNAYSYEGLTFDGITFDNSRILLAGWRNGDETIKNLAVTNCTFKNLNDNTNTAPIHINKDASEAVNGFTFTNNVIDGATGGSKSGIYAQVTGEVKVENNIINNVSFRPYVIQVTTDDGIADNFTVKGNTFSGSAAGRAQGLGNNAEGTDNVNLVVSNNIFKGITESQQICYWNFNPETTTADLSKNYYDIDIVANPNKIYFNSPAADNFALRDMNVFPIYTALNEDGTINTESAFTPKFYIAKVGENSYESLSEAVAAAQAGDEIVLIADVKTTDGVVITDKNLTIDLNGKTYTVTEGANTNNRNFKINGTSVVTVKNGTMVAAGQYSSGAYGTIRTEGTANVTLTGLKLYNYRGNGLNIKAYAGTTVTIENTEIYANYGGGIEAAGGTIVVNDGVTVEQKGMYTAPYNSMAISVNGGGKVTVNGGTFSTECITAEEANNQGTSHGPWVAGVLNSGGTLIINGGTFSNDNFGENSLATAARGAILADTKAKVEINGGTFNVLKNVIDIQNNLGDANNNPSVLLVGGTYSADPRISAQYGSNLITLAEGYMAVENNGVWTVVKAAAKIGTTAYATFADALAAAQAGDAIELLADVNADAVILLGKSLTINGNGYKVTSNATRVFRVTTANTKVTLNDVNMVSRTVMVYPNDIRGISIDAGLQNVELTLNNCSVDFTDATACDWAYAVNVSGNGTGHTVTVNGGTYEGANVINVHGANNTVVVKDATLTSLYPNNALYFGACIWVLQNQGSSVEATENTFNGSNAIAFNLGTGTALTESDNIDNTKYVVAKIGAEYYTSLADAFAAGGEVKVLQNIVLAETAIVPAGKVVTLDLNGKTISQTKECTASYEMICNKGNLTITGNGKISFTDTSAGDPNFGWGSYTVRNEGNLVVENGTIEHLGTQTFGTHCIMALYQYAGSTTINGGTISTPYYRSARLWKGNMTINGGTFDGQVWAQAVDNSANLVINGGTFEPNGNDASAVFVTNNQYDVQFAVTDGTFNGKVGCSDAVKLAGAIKGGKFNETAKNGTNSALLATGSIFGAVADANGYFAIEDDPTTHYIANLDDLKAFRDAVNNGTNYYDGVNVYLTADIDMAGENWVGIGTATAEHGFMGNFDGQGYKIKNLTIDNPALDSDGYAYAGLFGVTEGTDKDNQNTIKNLTIENVTINTTGDIVSAAIAYPYYTIVDNVKVCGNIAITGGNYTAGVLAYTRRCVNASNLAIVGNEGSFVKGNQTVGGVISDIQMNGGLTAVYSNFSAEGITVTGEKSVGGISGIIATQTLNGATVKNVTLNSSDARVGIVAGCLGGTSTISNVTYENVTGAATLIGASYDNAKAVAAKIGDTYYATLEAALAAQGNEVELLATYEVAAGETKTLDLMGKTVIGTPVEAKAYAVIINKGNLTITGNGSVICNHTLAGSTGYAVNTITNGGTLTIDGATIENKSTAQYQIGYAIDNNSTTGDAIINIKAGKVIASGSSYYDGIRLFCNSMTKKNDVIVSGGEVSTIWMQNPSDGAEKNTKDVAGNVEISGGKVGVLSLEPSANFEAAVTDGHIGEISYFQTAEGRDLVQFVTGGSFDNDVNQFCALGYQAVETGGLYNVSYTGKVAEFTIVDGEYTEFNIEEDVEVGTLTYERNFSAANRWNALYVPFEIPVELLTQAGYEVAYVNDVHSYDNLKADGTPGEDGVIDDMKMEVILIKNGKLNANYPYLIRANSAGLLSLEIENAKLYTTEEKSVSCSSVFMKFEVTGIYESKTAGELGDANSIYALGGGVWTLPESSNQQLKPFRLYLKATKIDGSPVVVDESTLANIRIRVAGEKDEVTGIITPIIEGDVHVNDGTVYDLMGRPVRTPEKGKIYIMNGKKVLF